MENFVIIFPKKDKMCVTKKGKIVFENYILYHNNLAYLISCFP